MQTANGCFRCLPEATVQKPPWIEWLMGVPIGWTDCDASEMQSCHKSLSGSADD